MYDREPLFENTVNGSLPLFDAQSQAGVKGLVVLALWLKCGLVYE